MNIWEGRRVFVTGHTGFKGGWLSLWLHEVGARVFGYGLLPESEPNLFAAAGIDCIVDSTIADIFEICPRYAKPCSAARQRSCSTLRLSRWCNAAMQIPIGTYSTNVMGNGTRSGGGSCVRERTLR